MSLNNRLGTTFLRMRAHNSQVSTALSRAENDRHATCGTSIVIGARLSNRARPGVHISPKQRKVPGSECTTNQFVRKKDPYENSRESERWTCSSACTPIFRRKKNRLITGRVKAKLNLDPGHFFVVRCGNGFQVGERWVRRHYSEWSRGFYSSLSPEHFLQTWMPWGLCGIPTGISLNGSC